jgi:hypothetical protein
VTLMSRALVVLLASAAAALGTFPAAAAAKPNCKLKAYAPWLDDGDVWQKGGVRCSRSVRRGLSIQFVRVLASGKLLRGTGRGSDTTAPAGRLRTIAAGVSDCFAFTRGVPEEDPAVSLFVRVKLYKNDWHTLLKRKDSPRVPRTELCPDEAPAEAER